MFVWIRNLNCVHGLVMVICLDVKHLFHTVLKGQNEQVGGLGSVCKNTTKLYGYLI